MLSLGCLSIFGGFSLKVKFESRIAGFTYLDPLLLCVVFRGGLFLDGVLSMIVSDGDLSLRAVELLKSSTHFQQVNYAMFDGSSWSGGLDLDFLYESLGKPIIVVYECEESNSVFLSKFNLYVKFRGVSLSRVEALLDISTLNLLPEPLRVARLLALSLLDALSFS